MYGQPNYYGNQYFAQPMQYRQPMQQPTYQPQQIQQPVITQPNTQNQQMLQGKSVDSVDVVKAMDIPLDGTISYFPLTDGTAIVTKQLQMDGTSKTVVYKPIDLKEEEKELPKYVTSEELNNAISKIDINSLKEESKTLKKQLKDITREIEDLKEGK